MVTIAAADPTSLLARASLFALSARGLVYPDDRWLAEMRDGRWLDQLRLAAAALDEPTPLAAPLAALAGAIAVLPTTAHGLAEEHTLLFARQVLVPPYASSYAVDPGQSRAPVLQSVMAHYAAFGLRIDPNHPDLPDHIGALLEFLAVLLAKEAYALTTGLAEAATLCCDTRRRFSQEHLVDCLPRFVERLTEKARLPFYPAVGALIQAVVAVAGDGDADAICSAAPAGTDPTAWPLEDDAFVCGMLPGGVPVDEPEGF